MADKTIHSLPLTTLKTGLEIPAVDYSRDLGDRNVRVFSDDIFTQIGRNKNTASYKITTGNVAPILKGQTVSVPIYQNPTQGDTSDMFLVGLQISVVVSQGQGYTYAIYAGDPANGGTVAYSYTSPVTANFHTMPSTVYVSYDTTDTIYLQITNAVGGGFTFDTKALVLEVATDAPALPAAPPPPPPYTGPQLQTINVGPTRDTFVDLSYVFPQGLLSFTTAAGSTTGSNTVTLTDASNVLVNMCFNTSTYVAPGALVQSVNGNVVTLSQPLLADLPASTAMAAAYRPAVLPGGTVVLDGNATYFRPVHICQGYDGTTIKGPRFAGAPAICDGRGGVGSGAAFRLAFGNGFINSSSALTVDGIWFQNCGGADRVGDGEAALYFVNFAVPGVSTVTHCRFDGNENGLFVPFWSSGPTGGGNISMNISYCDFGYTKSNGQSGDGQSHDFYINCRAVTVDHCNFYGTNPDTGGAGNCIKSRSQSTTVTNCWIRHSDDRCIDCPDGGYLTVSDTTFTSASNAVANYIGYGNENQNAGYQPTTFTNCRFETCRFEDTIWNCCIVPGSVMTFVNPTVQLYDLGGAETTRGSIVSSPDTTGTYVGLTFPIAAATGTVLPNTMPTPPAPVA